MSYNYFKTGFMHSQRIISKQSDLIALLYSIIRDRSYNKLTPEQINKIIDNLHDEHPEKLSNHYEEYLEQIQSEILQNQS